MPPFNKRRKKEKRRRNKEKERKKERKKELKDNVNHIKRKRRKGRRISLFGTVLFRPPN